MPDTQAMPASAMSVDRVHEDVAVLRTRMANVEGIVQNTRQEIADTRVSLTDAIKELSGSVHQLREEYHNGSRTPWGTILSFIALLIPMIGSLFWITQLQARIELAPIRAQVEAFKQDQYYARFRLDKVEDNYAKLQENWAKENKDRAADIAAMKAQMELVATIILRLQEVLKLPLDLPK